MRVSAFSKLVVALALLLAFDCGKIEAAPSVLQSVGSGASSFTTNSVAPSVTFGSNVTAGSSVYAVVEVYSSVITPSCTYNSVSMTLNGTSATYNAAGGSTMIVELYLFYAVGVASVNAISCTVNGVLTTNGMAAWEISGMLTLAPLYVVASSACTSTGCTATTATQTFSGNASQYMLCLGINSGSSTIPSASGLSASGSTLASGRADGNNVAGYDTAGWSAPANSDSCIDKSNASASAYGGLAVLYGWDTAASTRIAPWIGALR